MKYLRLWLSDGKIKLLLLNAYDVISKERWNIFELISNLQIQTERFFFNYYIFISSPTALAVELIKLINIDHKREDRFFFEEFYGKIDFDLNDNNSCYSVNSLF